MHQKMLCLASLLLAGAAVLPAVKPVPATEQDYHFIEQAKQVTAQSSRSTIRPKPCRFASTSDAQTPENFAATIYDAFGIPSSAEWHDTTGRPYAVYMGEPIRGLRQ